MLDRYERILKWAGFALAALLVLQISRIALRANPLKSVTVPAIPRLDPKPEALADVNPATLSKGGAGESTAHSTERAASKTTNSSDTRPGKDSKASTTDVVADRSAPTNQSVEIGANVSTNSFAANATTSADKAALSKTNSPKTESHGMVAATGMAGARASSHHGGPPKASDLPPVIQARVDRITESEILAPVVHPMPAALIGIAGERVFLRSSSGQTGMVKEGDELGGMKLLCIGTNRVLVEEGGEKKELMIFAGMGGDSLLPKDKKDQ